MPYAEVMASFPSMERATSQELWGNDASVLEIDQVNCANSSFYWWERFFFSAIFLDAIASSSCYPCQSISWSVGAFFVFLFPAIMQNRVFNPFLEKINKK